MRRIQQRRPRHVYGRRDFQLSWNVLKLDDLDYVTSFFDSLKDSAGDYSVTEAFYWTPPRPVHSPLGDSPKLEEVAGGSLGV